MKFHFFRDHIVRLLSEKPFVYNFEYLKNGRFIFMLEKNEAGVEKFEIIAPLLNPNLTACEKRRLRSEIMAVHGISERTLRRYMAAYKKLGFKGLLPKPKSKGYLKAISEKVLQAAIQLKRELPERSVRRIITILEKEGLVAVSELSRSTLSHILSKRNYTRKELLRGEFAGKTAARRFARCGRNSLWQSDIKYGPYIPDGRGGKNRTYLISFIDDATRVITHSEFYDNQRLPMLEDCFRKAVIKFGKPDDIYVDNGRQYTSRWFRIACARLKIRYMNARAYSPESKGKIERYNATVEEFFQELSLEPVDTLTELNRKYKIWLEEGYHRKPHSSLDGETPMERFQGDARHLRMATAEECYDAFLHEETRKVDGTGCVSVDGVLYEAGMEFCGKKLDLRFDPFDLSRVEIWYSGRKIKTVEPIIVREYCGRAVKTSRGTQVGRSRLLEVYSAENAKKIKRNSTFLSFANLEEEKNV